MGLTKLLLISAAGLAVGQPHKPPRPHGPPEPPKQNDKLVAALQEQVDSVVAHFKTAFPHIAIGAAWKDASNEAAVASGKVHGYEVTRQDTFLYGSGTKPFTATAILRLIDAGKVKATDKVSHIIDPYMQAHGKPISAYYFGEAFANATVLELIRMGAGIRDFEDDYGFDTETLENGTEFWDYPYDAIAWSVSENNTKGGPPLYCNPGTCTAYSSTSYEVAGLVLAAVLQPQDDWYALDLASAVFNDPDMYPSAKFLPDHHREPVQARIRHALTVPGSSVGFGTNVTIYNQNPSVLGWTCGNMVSSPNDVAKFFYHLLNTDHDPNPLLSDASRAEMTNFQYVTTGWNAHKLQYGAGLMNLHYTPAKVFVQGHEGDTYGFLSAQGYAPDLKGAFSVVTNVDSSMGNEYPVYIMTCYLLQSVLKVVHNNNTDLGCSLLAAPAVIV